MREQYKPSISEPLVYHLHGYLEIPQSILLTEDDYLDFLVSLQKGDEILPREITFALAANALIFVGYGLADWNFRVLIRSVYLFGDVFIQMRSEDFGRKDHAIKYLDRYYPNLFRGSSEMSRARVYWGGVADFIKELRYRLDRS